MPAAGDTKRKSGTRNVRKAGGKKTIKPSDVLSEAPPKPPRGRKIPGRSKLPDQPKGPKVPTM